MLLDEKKALHWVLRIGVFGTFVGHGLIAISVNSSWFPYLVVFGFNVEQIRILMPIIGALDVVVALWILLKPNKYVLFWAIGWAFATAVIRPLSGEPILAFIERAANWAVPLALYLSMFYKVQTKKST